MADYRLSVYVAKRSEGRSATAMAAYRACEVVNDKRTGERFDFSRKSGLLYSEVIAPPGAPEWARDREQLWNRSEAAHTREKAIIAREIQLSLPHELDAVERRELACHFASYMAERYGVAVDLCIHAPNKEGDQRNYHAHLLICTRPIDETKRQGLGNNVRAFDAVASQRSGEGNHVEIWRATWAEMMNDALERAQVRDADGAVVTVDHRSYKARGLNQEPTIKEGTAATALKRRGEYTERAEINETIRSANAERLARVSQPAMQGVSRKAQQMTTEEITDELPLPKNDRAKHEEVFEALPWETQDEARERAERALESARQREQKQQHKKHDWDFSR